MVSFLEDALECVPTLGMEPQKAGGCVGMKGMNMPYLAGPTIVGRRTHTDMDEGLPSDPISGNLFL